MSLTIQDFNNQCVVRIVEYKPVDNTPTSTHVVFEVKVLENSRVGAFICDVDTTALSSYPNHTPEEVTAAAWDLVKSNVSAWAIVNIPHQVLSDYEVPSTTNPIALQTFKDSFTTKVVRYELFPTTAPTSWCIGIKTEMKNRVNVSIYSDVLVPVDSWCNNVYCVDVVAAAWDLMKEKVCAWAVEQLDEPPVLNSVYTPTSLA